MAKKSVILLSSFLTFNFSNASDFKEPPTPPLTENPDVEDQIKGNYPPLERHESLPLGAIQHAWDRGKDKSGVYVVTYHPREVIPLRTREMMTTTLVFPQWERIQEVILGDEASFKATIHQESVVLIRPLEFIGVDTSLTLLGASGKVYSFYIRSEGYNSKNISDLKVYVRVPTPSGPPLLKETLSSKNLDSKKDPTKKADYLEEVAFDPSKLDFRFSMAGEKSLAPTRIYTDGIRTWFDYGSEIQKQNLPAVYAVIDGVDTPLNVTRVGSKLMAPSHPKYTLRNGQKITCVWQSIEKN